MNSTAVRGGFDRFLMTPWMGCHNPSCYKNRAVLAQAANRTRKNSPLLPHALVMPPCGYRPINPVSQVERRHSDAAPGLGDRVCVVVGDEDGNRIFFSFFEK